ncbi:MAG: hypothetical protein DBX55_06605 [Verrucomicrobia bacterium]|nr:MAG: hypothetical protein DBX55_06605 [Verrucomicrobiota bacterium]
MHPRTPFYNTKIFQPRFYLTPARGRRIILEDFPESAADCGRGKNAEKRTGRPGVAECAPVSSREEGVPPSAEGGALNGAPHFPIEIKNHRRLICSKLKKSPYLQ